ncbi:MAG TPA: hypothetical protein PKM21_18165 [Anaerolineales bacterium]|nr:hypothetical protein [Anaerolineales bacterium]
MDDLFRIAPGQLHLLIAPHATARQLMNALAARLALAGSLQVLDGGNSLDVYAIAHLARQNGAHPETVLQRITIARAFTCYQMARLLIGHSENHTPTLVFDLLTTFYDENIRLGERLRLLGQGLAALKRLSRQSPVAVSTCPVLGQPDALLERLAAAADQCWQVSALASTTQPTLF